MKLAKFTCTVLMAGSAFLLPVAPASAQSEDRNITLKSFDGFTQLRGKLIEFDGSTYTIDTVLGVIQVDGLQVDCEGAACPKDVLFNAAFGIYGSNTIGTELMPALIEGYADSIDATMVAELQSNQKTTLRIVHEDGREMAAIDLDARSSSAGFNALATGGAEIGMSARRARDVEIQALNVAGMDDPRDTENEHVLALDGLIAVVHPSNPVQSVSLEELALIFSGTVSNWAQIGGSDAPINLYALQQDSGTFQTFGSLVLAPYDVDITPVAQRFGTNIQLSDAVATDPNGIGVTGIAFERAARALPIRQECGIMSYPSSFAMKTEEYPLARRLYLYAPRLDTTAHARQIIEFAKSDDAQSLISESGFVNLKEEQASINAQGGRIVYALTGEEEVSVPLLREFLGEVRDAVRLSTTFRFTPGSSQLEPKSQRDAERFAADIASGRYDGKEIMLVGFTDSVGQFELNRGLSARRAQVVDTTLRAFAPPEDFANALISVLGYGELAPVGCNTTLKGRSSNRRVEVWLRDRRS